MGPYRVRKSTNVDMWMANHQLKLENILSECKLILDEGGDSAANNV